MVVRLQKQYYIVLGGSLLFGTILLLASTNSTATSFIDSGNSTRKLLIEEQSKHAKDASEILEHIHEQCRKYNTTISDEKEKNKVMNAWLAPKSYKEHRLLYHFNPKTGSTSFKRWLRRIDGDDRPYEELKGNHHPSNYLSWPSIAKDNPERAKDHSLYDSFYKIGFIRNPMVRFVSGFRDKVLRRTFFKDQMNEVMPGYKERSDVEVFPVFVDEFLSGRLYNYHFSIQYEKMGICWIPYDTLLQTETTLAQIKTVQEHTNTTMFEYPGSRLEVGDAKESTVEYTKRYFATLTEDQLERFYQYYQWDFILPGYSKLNDTNFPYLNW